MQMGRRGCNADYISDLSPRLNNHKTCFEPILHQSALDFLEPRAPVLGWLQNATLVDLNT